MKERILIVEDDPAFAMMLQKWLQKNGFDPFVSTRISQARKELSAQSFSLILSDLRLPDGEGIELLEWIKEQAINTPVIMMTSYAGIQSAVAAMKNGAFDYLEKPVNPSLLKQKIDQALHPVATGTQEPKEKAAPATPAKSDKIEGNSAASAKMYHHIRMVAPTRMAVMILGESGTGKEYAARLIHESSDRREKPFIAVDCGSLGKELAPSELFGHLKGSFTSAIANKTGVFELANGGTVFLDEVGNLPYEVQVQLLRALQEQKIRPVGSAVDIDIDVRLVSATNEDLEKAITEGRFRMDLYHRLNEFAIEVPPLRERPEDLELFAELFLNEANKELNKKLEGFSPAALQHLKAYHWPGNLRELRNVVRRAALFTEETLITPDNLPELINPVAPDTLSLPISRRSDNEREVILQALERTRGNKSEAAKLLQIDRKTLYNKMHQHNIEL
ncbi:MAG: sigma-54 dependent transcriptional regulator [Bacteroidales bacterium]